MGSLGVAVPSSSLAAGNQLRVSILVGESKFSAQMVGKILPCHSCQREARPQCDPGATRRGRNVRIVIETKSSGCTECQSSAQQRVEISHAAARSTTRFHFVNDAPQVWTIRDY